MTTRRPEDDRNAYEAGQKAGLARQNSDETNASKWYRYLIKLVSRFEHHDAQVLRDVYSSGYRSIQK